MVLCMDFVRKNIQSLLVFQAEILGVVVDNKGALWYNTESDKNLTIFSKEEEYNVKKSCYCKRLSYSYWYNGRYGHL